LTDVNNAVPPVDGDGLVYNSATGKFDYAQMSVSAPWTTDGTSWVNNNNIGPSVVINNTNSLFGSD